MIARKEVAEMMLPQVGNPLNRFSFRTDRRQAIVNRRHNIQGARSNRLEKEYKVSG